MRTVLLVDDEPRVVQALVQHIPWEACRTSVIGTAGDAEEAMAQYAALRPDIIITDVHMPGEDGLEFVRKVRQLDADIPVIILSGYDKFEYARQAMQLDIAYFLLKPVPVDELAGVLKELCQELDARDKEMKLKMSYEAELATMLPALREHFMMDLLNSRLKPADITAGRLEFLKLDCPDHSVAISVQVIRPQDLPSSMEREWQLIRYGAVNMMEEILCGKLQQHPELRGVVVAASDQRFVVVLMNTTDARHLTETAAFAISESVIANIVRHLKISATVGIGHCKPGLSMLSKSYMESREALDISEYESLNRVYHINDAARMKDDDSGQLPLEGMKQIHKALADHSVAVFQESWSQMVAGIAKSGQRVSLSNMQIVCINIVSSMTMAWVEMFEQEPCPFDMSASIKEIYRYPAVYDLIGWMNTVVEQWCKAATKESGSKKYHRLIAQVKQYVDEHYDQEIQFSAIAKSLYVSRNYLSHLFKKETGETFVTYLNKYRIAKAKQLMQQNQYKLYEVSEMVGYQNATYFCEMFKSITGQSPSKYVGG